MSLTGEADAQLLFDTIWPRLPTEQEMSTA
jgi:hypothetical protein